MNTETARHLNALRLRALSPIELRRAVHGSTLEVRFHGEDDRHDNETYEAERSELYAYIEACRVRVEAQAVAEEIRAAAAEGRDADTYTGSPDQSLISWGQVNGHAAGAGGRALAMCIADIQREMDRRNADALARYETYRTACAQGVAVPPIE